MPADREAGFQHLHPASLVFQLGRALGQFLVPALLVVVLGRGERFELWLAVLAVPAAAAALVRYLTYRYRLGSEELVIRQGVLRRNERHIPFERIQNIDTTRSLVHRLLGVADVTIQTASGSQAEAVMRVLSLDAVAAMRQHVFAHPTAQDATDTDIAPTAPPPEVLARVSDAELVRYGFISNRGLVALAAVLGLLWQVDLDPTRWLSDRLPGVDTVAWPRLVLAGALLVVAGLVVLRLLSVAWSVVTFHGFTLSRDEDELVARYGLLTERAVTIPCHRIQLVMVEENLLHRLLRRVSVWGRTAGTNGDHEHQQHPN